MIGLKGKLVEPLNSDWSCKVYHVEVIQESNNTLIIRYHGTYKDGGRCGPGTVEYSKSTFKDNFVPYTKLEAAVL